MEKKKPKTKKGAAQKKARIYAMGRVIEETGAKNSRAASICGIPDSTLCDWLKDPEIAEYFKTKFSKWVKDRLGIIKDSDDWHAHGWLLERAVPEEFGPPLQRREHSGPGGGPIEIADARATLISRIDSIASRSGTPESPGDNK